VPSMQIQPHDLRPVVRYVHRGLLVIVG
jgi:hypothetical protein